MGTLDEVPRTGDAHATAVVVRGGPRLKSLVGILRITAGKVMLRRAVPGYASEAEEKEKT